MLDMQLYSCALARTLRIDRAHSKFEAFHCFFLPYHELCDRRVNASRLPPPLIGREVFSFPRSSDLYCIHPFIELHPPSVYNRVVV